MMWFQQQLRCMNEKTKSMLDDAEKARSLYSEMHRQIPAFFQKMLPPTSSIDDLQRSLMINHDQEISIVKKFIKHLEEEDGSAYKRLRLNHAAENERLRRKASGRSRQQADSAALLKDSSRRCPPPPIWKGEEQPAKASDEELKKAIHSKFAPVFGASHVKVDILSASDIAGILNRAQSRVAADVSGTSTGEFMCHAIQELSKKRSVDDIVNGAVDLKNEWKKRKQ